MNTAKKAICKTLATRKGLPGLGELCTKQLWVQSIDAGKAKELVETLEESQAGLCALKAVVGRPMRACSLQRSPAGPAAAALAL